jgi:NADH:ubiquinone oxidoreductase subunit E
VIKIIDALKNKKSVWLLIINVFQKEAEHILFKKIDRVAKKLQQIPAKIHNVISFYHQLSTSQPSDSEHKRIQWTTNTVSNRFSE